MTRLTTDVNPREGRVTPERWIAFLEGFSHVTKALAREFPELAVSVPVVTLQQRSPHRTPDDADREEAARLLRNAWEAMGLNGTSDEEHDALEALAEFGKRYFRVEQTEPVWDFQDLGGNSPFGDATAGEDAVNHDTMREQAAEDA